MKYKLFIIIPTVLALLVFAIASGLLRPDSIQSQTVGKTTDKLTPLQYKVTKENGTEPPFKNEYWDNKEEGIYVCIISGEPLYSSKDKFDSGTGWPSFTKALDDGAVEERVDKAHGMIRTEVRSIAGDSHLGHIFDDGPKPTGKRHCINSAALRFIPAKELEKEGYAEYSALFTANAKSATKSESGKTEKMVVGAGCFWCVEEIYDHVPGVIGAVSGYAGGSSDNPTYESVGSGKTDHAEAVEIEFDPSKVSLDTLLKVFWKSHDATDPRGVSPDYGPQYRSMLLYANAEQRDVVLKSVAEQQKKLSKPIVTEVARLKRFYPAEKYHQDYVKQNPENPYVKNVSIPRLKKLELPKLLSEKEERVSP